MLPGSHVWWLQALCRHSTSTGAKVTFWIAATAEPGYIVAKFTDTKDV